jgi:hypothetical protein
VEAERALRSLNRLRVVVVRARIALALIPPRSAAEHRTDLAEVGLVRAFSILESYLSDRGDTLVRRDLPVPVAPAALTRAAHTRILGAFRGSFDSGPVAFWKEGLELDLKTFPGGWSKVSDYRDLRNLIVHGLAYVRPGGSRLRPSIAARIRSFTSDPENYTGRVPVSDKDYEDCVKVASAFIKWVDRQRP